MAHFILILDRATLVLASVAAVAALTIYQKLRHIASR
jgi:hypothetical protein